MFKKVKSILRVTILLCLTLTMLVTSSVPLFASQMSPETDGITDLTNDSEKAAADKNEEKDNAAEDYIIDDSIIVVYKEGAEDLSDKSIKNEIGLVSEREFSRLTGSDTEVKDGIKAGKKMTLLKTEKNGISEQQKRIERLKKDPNVEYAFPNVYSKPFSQVPNDPQYPNQMGYMNLIEANYTWDKIQGTNTIDADQNKAVVAVIDHGIDLQHEDFGLNTPQCNIWTNPNPDPIMQDVHGYNFMEHNGVLSGDSKDPDRDHGTSVSAILGAVGNDGKGMAGIAWNIKMAMLKSCSYASLVEAIDYATSKGFPIINFSGGWEGSRRLTSDDAIVLKQKIAGYTGLFVAAAGNLNQNLDDAGAYCYPAQFKCANMIVVGAVNNGGSKWIDAADKSKGTNYGSCVDIFAPGENIVCPAVGGRYVFVSGTSYAAPLVAGAAAMLYANGVRDIHELKDRILNNAQFVNGNKILNVAKLFPYKYKVYSIPVKDKDYIYLLHKNTIAKQKSDANDEDKEARGATFNWKLRPNGGFYTLTNTLSMGVLLDNVLKLSACWDGTFVLNKGDAYEQVTCEVRDPKVEKPVSFQMQGNLDKQRWRFDDPIPLEPDKPRNVSTANGSQGLTVRDPILDSVQAGSNVVVPMQIDSGNAHTFSFLSAPSSFKSETNSMSSVYCIKDNITGEFLNAPASEGGNVIEGKNDSLGAQWDITPVGDNNYLIESKLYHDKVLTISQDGSRIILDKYKDPQKQQWKIYFDDNYDYFGRGTYNIITYRKGALEIPCGNFPTSIYNETRIQEVGGGTYTHQTWSIQRLPDGFYKIINRETGKLATVNTNDMSVFACTEFKEPGSSRDSQMWSIIPNEDCTFRIESKALKGLVFDSSRGSIAVKFWDISNKAEHFSIVQAVPGNTNYTLKTSNGNVLEIPGSSLSEHSQVGQYQWNGTPAQTWLIEPLNGGYYKIINRASGLVMSVEGDSPYKVVQRKYSGDLSQHWSISSNYDGTFNLQAAWRGQILALDISTGVALATPWKGDDTQCFRVEQTIPSNDIYRLRIKSSGQVLEVPGASSVERAQLGQYYCNGYKSQMWLFEPLSDGYYKITNQESSLVMDIDDIKMIGIQSTYMDSNNQKWRLVPNGDGTFHLQTKAGLVLDMSSGKACATTTWSGSDGTRLKISLAIKNGTYRIKHKAANLFMDLDTDPEVKQRIQLYKGNGQDQQKWRIRVSKDGYIIESRYNEKKYVYPYQGEPNGFEYVGIGNVDRYGNPSVQWQFEKEVDGSFKIVSEANTNYVFTPADMLGTKKRTDVGAYVRDVNLNCQKQWVLEWVGGSVADMDTIWPNTK